MFDMITNERVKMSTEKFIVGNEINSLCTRCKKPQIHIIISIVKEKVSKVQCRNCGGFHRYRDPEAPLKTPRKRSKISAEDLWEKKMTLVSAQQKIPYTFSGNFMVNDLIDHSTFGLGVVTHLLSEDKIQVIFKDGEKILVARR
jgi:late competence protein required for DNA uptake (superfamily II DNA/RNA helicase)